MTEIYRLFTVSPWGHENDLKHFSKLKDAEKEFYKLVKKEIAASGVKQSDLEEGKPFKITDKPHCTYKNSKLYAEIKFWEKTSYEIEEWDISEFDVILQAVEVH